MGQPQRVSSGEGARGGTRARACVICGTRARACAICGLLPTAAPRCRVTLAEHDRHAAAGDGGEADPEDSAERPSATAHVAAVREERAHRPALRPHVMRRARVSSMQEVDGRSMGHGAGGANRQREDASAREGARARGRAGERVRGRGAGGGVEPLTARLSCGAAARRPPGMREVDFFEFVELLVALSQARCARHARHARRLLSAARRACCQLGHGQDSQRDAYVPGPPHPPPPVAAAHVD